MTTYSDEIVAKAREMIDKSPTYYASQFTFNEVCERAQQKMESAKRQALRDAKHAQFQEHCKDVHAARAKRAAKRQSPKKKQQEELSRQVTEETPFLKAQINRHFRTFHHLRQICVSTTYRDYPFYGGRGIKIAPEWEDFETFVRWSLANGFEFDLVLGRRDMDGDFTPENCVFRTRAENTHQMNEHRRKQ